jgi:hypothetical protein
MLRPQRYWHRLVTRIIRGPNRSAHVIVAPRWYESIQTLAESLNGAQRATARVQRRWGHNRDREYSRFWGHQGGPIEIANKSPRQNISHRERAPEREEGVWGEDVAPLALFPQLLEREVHLRL